MKPILKAALTSLVCASAIFLTFSVPQIFLLGIKHASEGTADTPPFPLKTVLIFASIPTVVAGLIAFFSFWYYFRTAKKTEDSYPVKP